MSGLSKCTGGILVYRTLAAVAILVVGGCGGGSGGSTATGGGAGSTGVDAAAPADDAGSIAIHREAGGGGVGTIGDSGSAATSSSAASAGTTSMYDNTLGNVCQSDLDCEPAGGPGVNTCSLTTFSEAIFPTAVCIQKSCDPGTDGATHFCDGPDAPSSPGVCVNLGGTPPTGLCLPTCLFASDGSAAVGCQANDACVLYDFGTLAVAPAGGAGTTLIGVGYCFGGCTKDADCPTGNLCQVNEGICVKSVAAPTKTIGTACTAADNGSSASAATCDCFLNSSTMKGACSQFCLVGSTADPCPSGYVCDALEPTELTDQAGASMPGFPTQNAGLAGSCVATCTDEGGTCGASMFSCLHDTVAGPDCLP
jgi:hypothetical protein